MTRALSSSFGVLFDVSFLSVPLPLLSTSVNVYVLTLSVVIPQVENRSFVHVSPQLPARSTISSLNVQAAREAREALKRSGSCITFEELETKDWGSGKEKSIEIDR